LNQQKTQKEKTTSNSNCSGTNNKQWILWE